MPIVTPELPKVSREFENGLPTSLKIGRIEYKIRQDRDEYLEGNNLLGQVEYVACEITIHSKITGIRKRQVLLHEAAHAMLHETGFQDYGNETIIHALEMALYQFLSDNDFGFMLMGEQYDKETQVNE